MDIAKARSLAEQLVEALRESPAEPVQDADTYNPDFSGRFSQQVSLASLSDDDCLWLKAASAGSIGMRVYEVIASDWHSINQRAIKSIDQAQNSTLNYPEFVRRAREGLYYGYSSPVVDCANAYARHLNHPDVWT